MAVIYPIGDIRIADPLAWGYLIAATALTVALWHFRRQIGRGPLAGALFFAVTLLPVLGFVDYGYMQYAFVADRFQYLAGIGVMAIVIGAASYSVCRLPSMWQKGALGVAALALVVLGLLTWQQASIWRNKETLWRHVVTLNPQARDAHLSLSKVLYRQKRYAEALEAARVAVEQRPNYYNPHATLGAIFNALGRFEEAETHLRHAITLHPQGWYAHLHLGDALYKQGRYEEALKATRVAVEQRPNYYNPHATLGAIFNALGRFEEAETHLRRALALNPQAQVVHLNLGDALYKQGRYEEAMDLIAQAAALAPDSMQAAKLHFLMGETARENGQPEAAAEHYMNTLEMDLHHGVALHWLATLRLEQQRYDEALELFHRLIALHPNDAATYSNMGIALSGLGRHDEALQRFDQALSLDPALENVRANREALLEALEGNVE